MNTLKVEESEHMEAKEAMELIDCGRATERTQGYFMGVNIENSYPPFHYAFF